MSTYNFLLLFITILLEFVILKPFLKGKTYRLLAAIFFINILTVPAANYLYTAFLPNLILVVLATILIETIFLFLTLEVKIIKALYLSFLINITSSLVTFLLTTFLF